MAAWVVYKSSDRSVISGHPTSAAATAAKGVGELTIAVKDADNNAADLPEWFFPGAYVTTKGVLLQDAPLSDLDTLKASLRGTHAQIFSWAAGVNAIASVWPAADVAKAHDWLVWGRVGWAQVAKSAQWTMAQRTAFSNGVSQGSKNVASPSAFFKDAAAVALAAPTAAVVWRNPDDGSAWTLAESKTKTKVVESKFASAPSLSELASGSWIEDITA